MNTPEHVKFPLDPFIKYFSELSEICWKGIVCIILHLFLLKSINIVILFYHLSACLGIIISRFSLSLIVVNLVNYFSNLKLVCVLVELAFEVWYYILVEFVCILVKIMFNLLLCEYYWLLNFMKVLKFFYLVRWELVF